MVYCHECGNKGDDDDHYCTKCGSHLVKTCDFEKKIDKYAEEFGRKAEQFGKNIEQKAKEFAKSVEENTKSKEKHCQECNIDIDGNDIYCWKCGKKL
jgi:hypothetical protein